MRIFKAQFKNKSGKTQKSKKWYIDFVDHTGARHRIPGLENKRRTEDLGRNIEDLVNTKAARQRPDRELTAWIETLSGALTKKLISFGLLDSHYISAGKLLADHLEDFKESLLADGLMKLHASTTHYRIKQIFDGCGFTTWSDVSASRVQKYISDLQKKLAAKTAKDYLQAAKQFCGWMVQDRRTSDNPLKHLKPVTVTKDDIETRRALEPDELRWLLEVTGAAPTRYRMSGHERALLYRLAAETGLRSAEIRSLTASSFDFDDNNVTVENKITKNRKGAYLPLKADTANEIKEIASLKLGKAKVFNMPHRSSVVKMLRKDLTDARQEWIDEAKGNPTELKRREKSDFLKDKTDDGKVDFHALRHYAEHLIMPSKSSFMSTVA